MGPEIKTFGPNISVYEIPHSIFGGYGETWRRFLECPSSPVLSSHTDR